MNELLSTAINEILAQQRYILTSLNEIKTYLKIKEDRDVIE
ncbi:hypothetical protein SM120_11510 [Lactococcus lactis subsp. lactis]|nr:hypothetical protein [Lactococcus lactis]MDY4364257.1 hypothetical protein [Lactococcus lactis subsp. lactis]